MNIFIQSINDRKITSEIELKRLFWKLSVKYHPDTTKINDSEKHFIKIKNDFEEAKNLLKDEEQIKSKPESVQYNRIECISVFTNLIQSNFPLDKRIKDNNKTYLLRLQLFSTYLSLSCPENYGLMSKVEKELYQIQNSKLHKGIYGIVKFLLHNICSFHYCYSRFAYNAIIKNFNEIQAELIEKNLSSTYQFLKWLIDDMDKGSALL